jgi:flagellar biosynthetic protein FlhB
MSQDTPQDSKTFDPTPQRIQQFREEGKVASSKDVTSAVMFVASLLAFAFIGEDLFEAFGQAIRVTIEQLGADGGQSIGVWDSLVHAVQFVGPSMAVFGILVIGGVLAASFGQTRFLWAPKNLGFKWERINPVAKIAQILNPKQAGMQVLLSAMKITAGSWVIWLVVEDQFSLMVALSMGSCANVYDFVADLLFLMLCVTTIAFSVMAVVDYAWQKHQMMQQMKMTREEVKRDMEEQDGKPEVKSRRKQLHRELSMNRIIQAVPEADVVVTNPTHLALVIRYRVGEDAAPIVTAKGADSLAAYIRMLAREHGVPIVENKPLARVLWRRVRVGKRVPNSLFQAVAEILAGIFRARNQTDLRQGRAGTQDKR